jgi:hypothetical protein
MSLAEQIGIKIPEVLLPIPGIDLQKWAVIACDQFTSEPEYWQQVSDFVGDAPSTLRMILPEVWLHSPDVDERIRGTQEAMRRYLAEGLFAPHSGMILVEREASGQTRTGLMLALDLEAYDYNKGSQTLIRATEGTILDRLPPRMRVRRGAPLELPHILVLYDDPNFSVLAPVLAAKAELPLCYDFDLMLGSGHLTGRWVDQPELLEAVIQALAGLIEPQTYAQKYAQPEGTQPLLFAMGDGNHSLATAKAIWEELKPRVGSAHPARYALVEIENLHDPAIQFEAIHRVLFNVSPDFINELHAAFTPHIQLSTLPDYETLKREVLAHSRPSQKIGMLSFQGFTLIELTQPRHNLPVGSLQNFLDSYLAAHTQTSIDYVHGDDVLSTLGQKPGNLGFYLAPIRKEAFFKTVIEEGALPRKTFSMGHAKDKRFYLECRRITV